MTGIHGYPNVYAIGHKAIDGLFSSDVTVEEKIDGSQFSFGVIDGELQCRSKGKPIIVDAPEKMFAMAVASAKNLETLLKPGWVYRGEYLQKPKHNALEYARVPASNIIIFDICPSLESYLSHAEKFGECARIGLECVPLLYQGRVENMDEMLAFLERDSILGGTKVEGIVVKNYNLFTPDKKVAMGKYVREDFKETLAKEWGKANPSRGDILERLIAHYKTEARWQKAVQHLREAGTLEGSPRDIGALIKEVPADILKECADEIKNDLFEYFWPKIQRATVGGLPEWYKRELAKSAFEGKA